MYNQTVQSTGACMPLIMGYTQPGKIQEVENEEPVVYDQKKQKTLVLILRLVGTKSLKTSTTKVKCSGPGSSSYKQDKKNEIDDSKNV